MSDYPQHDKLKALVGANQTVGDFITWLRAKGYIICERHEADDYWPTFKTTDNLIADFFEIDEKELSREKDRMLEEFREKPR